MGCINRALELYLFGKGQEVDSANMRTYYQNYPVSLVVEDEECSKCGADLKGPQAVDLRVIGSKEWDKGSANPPFGNVTTDPLNPETPEEEDEIPDLRMSSDQLKVTCSACGKPLRFVAKREH